MVRRAARAVRLRPQRQEGALLHRRDAHERRGSGDRKTVLKNWVRAAFGLLGCSLLSANSLIFKHVTVIDATGAAPRVNMSVAISGTRITAIEKKIRVRRGDQVIEAKGKFLIPGLWEM